MRAYTRAYGVGRRERLRVGVGVFPLANRAASRRAARVAGPPRLRLRAPPAFRLHLPIVSRSLHSPHWGHHKAELSAGVGGARERFPIAPSRARGRRTRRKPARGWLGAGMCVLEKVAWPHRRLGSSCHRQKWPLTPSRPSAASNRRRSLGDDYITQPPLRAAAKLRTRRGPDDGALHLI